MFDLLIRGGLMVDGTGSPARAADVGVDHLEVQARSRVQKRDEVIVEGFAGFGLGEHPGTSLHQIVARRGHVRNPEADVVQSAASAHEIYQGRFGSSRLDEFEVQ